MYGIQRNYVHFDEYSWDGDPYSTVLKDYSIRLRYICCAKYYSQGEERITARARMDRLAVFYSTNSLSPVYLSRAR